MESYTNKKIEIDKDTFLQMQEMLLQFETLLTQKVEENKELSSKVEDLESIMKARDKAPDVSEALNRYKQLIREVANEK